jgi:hypothetical protein
MSQDVASGRPVYPCRQNAREGVCFKQDASYKDLEVQCQEKSSELLEIPYFRHILVKLA